MFKIMNQMVDTYIDKLTTNYPFINSIWMIGSRANNSFRDNSDWDFILFADRNTLDELRQDLAFDNDNIDLLVVYNGNDFEEPWADEKGIKKGSLTDWEWHQESDNEASYLHKKYKSEKDWFKANMFECKKVAAFKIWQRG